MTTQLSLELVPVFTAVIGDTPVNTVDARKLHAFLEVGTRFNDWINRRIDEYRFIQGVDFTSILTNEYSPPAKDYHVSIDMAKELAMVERTEKGKQARQYFIECERRLREQPKPLTPAEMILAQAQQLVDHERQLALVQRRLDAIESVQPKPATHSTIVGYAAALNLAVDHKSANKLGRRAASLCRIQGFPLVQIHDDRWGTVNSYPHPILDIVFHEYAPGRVAAAGFPVNN